MISIPSSPVQLLLTFIALVTLLVVAETTSTRSSRKSVSLFVSRTGTTLSRSSKLHHQLVENDDKNSLDYQNDDEEAKQQQNELPFAVVAHTKEHSIIVPSASISDLSGGMHYDGPLSRKQHEEMESDHDRNTMFHGEIAEFMFNNNNHNDNNNDVIPRDVTHCVRAEIPHEAHSVSLFDRKTGKIHGEQHQLTKNSQKTTTSTSSRDAQALLSQTHTNATIERRTIQLTDIRTQPTISILSGGYQQSERGSFFNDVDRVLNILKNGISSEGINPGPWPRYFSNFNVFALFEASAESGASYKTGSLHECPVESSGGCTARTVQNNLGCSYGTPRPRVLGCAYDDVMAVAGFAPLADIIIVIVNSNGFGGSGGGRVAVINRGSDMELTLLHQLNHAVANLGDEFTYGLTATPKNNIPNCQLTSDSWSAWITAGSVPATPTAGCTFGNLFRPTAESCIMRRKHSSMCPVCAEALNKAFFETNFKANGQLMALGAPRCPLRGYEVHLRSSDTAELTIDHAFIARGNVSITWVLPSGASISGISSLSIQGNQLNVGRSEIRVTINDNSPFVASANRPASMSQTVVFNMNRVDNLNNCTAVTCTNSRGLTNAYCAACIQDGGCGNTLTNAGSSVVRPPVTIPEQSTDNSAAAIATVVLVSIIILVVGFVVLCVYRRKNVVEVVVVAGGDLSLMYATVFFLVVVYVVTLLIVIYGVYSLPRAPIFGKDALLACLVIGALVCVLAALCAVSLYGKSTFGMFVPAGVMLLFALILVIASIYALWTSYNMETSSVQSLMLNAWKNKVSDNDNIICQVQNYFECSGYQLPCAMNPSKEYCLDSCTYSNRFTDPCLARFTTFAQEDMRPAAGAAVAGSFVVAICAVLVIVYAWRLKSLATNGKARRSYRHDPKQPVECVTDDELVELRSEFDKIAVSEGHGAESTEALRFVRDAFGEAVEADDESEIITAATSDGLVSLERVLHIMFPYLDPSNEFHDPRTLTEEEACRTRSTEELAVAHTKKHELYIKYAGALSPSELRSLYFEHCMPGGVYKPHPNFFGLIKAAAERNAQTVEGRMCRGLTAVELDGLRSLWARLNPSIDDDLSTSAIAAFYAVTHNGQKIRTQEHLARWKQTLDVLGRGRIGWPEFCLPFAQRALAEDARRFIIVKTQADLSVLEEEYGNLNRLLSRREVAVEYGEAYVDFVFLPGEEQVPLMRVIAAVVRGDVEMHRKLQ